MKRAIAAALLLAACSTRAKEGTLADTTADSTHPRAAADAVVSAKSLQALDDRYEHDWERPSCEMDTTVAHPAARALLDEYLQRDTSYGYAAGGPDENDDWLLAMAECPGHLGGTDGARVVTGYTVDSLPAGRDTARYVVHWRTIGSTTPEIDHMRFVPGTGPDADTLGFVHTPYGWRLMGAEVGDPTMGAAAVRSGLDSLSRARLEEAVRGAGRRD